MSKNEQRDPRRTNSKLGQLYWQHYERVVKQMQPKIMGHVSTEVLEGIESFAAENPSSPVTKMREEMMRTIEPDTAAGDPQAVSRFSELYSKASDIVFPATRAFLTVCHDVNPYSSSHSLSAIDLATLRAVDLEAHENPILGAFRTELKSRLEKVAGIDDVKAFSQVFETYGEIIAYLFLRERVPTERLREREGQQTPDFRCEPPDGKPFQVEVKTFDIVGGPARNSEIMYDGLETKAEVDEQLKAGKQVAIAAGRLAPYLKYGETDTYDFRSMIRVIDTLREKSLQSFKKGQFDEGPTFALAITDRLLLPHGAFDLAPYHYNGHGVGGISSGVLWHMAYGRPGTPIFRLPEFPGKPALEGHLERSGLFVDEAIPFPGPGLLVLHRQHDGHVALGLCNDDWSRDDDWQIDDTHHVLNMLCDRWNDRKSRRSFDISADIGQKPRG